MRAHTLIACVVMMFIGAPVLLSEDKPAGACLSYEPVEVKLTGRLVRKTFPGPPNYDSIKAGDRAETYWLLELERAVCVDASKTEPDLDPEQSDVRTIQLVVQPHMYKTKAALVGKRVVVTGTLFGQINAHHHTPVLLRVKTSVPQASDSW